MSIWKDLPGQFRPWPTRLLLSCAGNDAIADIAVLAAAAVVAAGYRPRFFFAYALAFAASAMNLRILPATFDA